MLVVDGINYLTVAETCALLEVKPATIYAYVSRGVLRSYKQGIKRQRLYRQDEVQALLAVQPGESARSEQGATSVAADQDDRRLPTVDDWIGER